LIASSIALYRVGERLHAVGDQHLGDVEERDLGLSERFDDGTGSVDVLEHRIGPNRPVIEQRVERVRRHGG